MFGSLAEVCLGVWLIFEETLLKAKSEAFTKAVGIFNDYEIMYRGLSVEDM